MHCPNCSKPVSDKDITVTCDMCKALVHSSCSSLTSDDVKRITRLKSKCVRFFCVNCTEDNDRHSELKEILKTVTDRLHALEVKITSSTNTLEPKIFEDILSEVRDRMNRERNILIFGVPESPSDNAQLSDLVTVNNILHTTTTDSSITACSVRRLGKTPNSNKPRPIKVVLNNTSDVKCVWKFKNRLALTKYDKIVFRDDQTPRQIQYLKLLRAELNNRIDGGETDLTIKYIKHVPTIVNKAISSKK